MSKKFSIIIPCYREGNKPLKLLEDIAESTLGKFELEKINVVTSDPSKIEEFSKNSELEVNILVEKERRGKACAINRALETTSSEMIVLFSGDISLEKNTIKRMLERLKDDKIGIVTSRPVPKCKDDNFVEHFVELLWKLHQLVSLKFPKAGEAIAFMNEISSIPENTAADEEFIMKKILKKGLKAEYAPGAVVHNQGPENVAGLFRQRWRIFIGHLDLKNRGNYAPPSMKTRVLLSTLLEYVKREGVHPYLFLSILFEGLARVEAWISYKIIGKNPYIWKKINR